MLFWPMIAVLGFLALAGVIVALGRGSTARYEYERNSVQAPQQPVAVPASVAGGGGSAAGAAGATEPGPAAMPGGAEVQEQRTAVGVAAHPAGKRTVDPGAVSAWWLIDESAEDPIERVVAGPFADRIEADWAALANGLSGSIGPVYGVQRADGAVVRRQTPQEREWLAELGTQLDRLPDEWDELLSDTDALTTLVVEVGAALVEAGLPLHDCSGRCADGGGSGGGVCLTPDPSSSGILVSWRQHDRMSVQQVRGAALDAAVQQTMNSAVASVLSQLGFEVEETGAGTGYRVTSAAMPLI